MKQINKKIITSNMFYFVLQKGNLYINYNQKFSKLKKESYKKWAKFLISNGFKLIENLIIKLIELKWTFILSSSKIKLLNPNLNWLWQNIRRFSDKSIHTIWIYELRDGRRNEGELKDDKVHPAQLVCRLILILN